MNKKKQIIIGIIIGLIIFVIAINNRSDNPKPDVDLPANKTMVYKQKSSELLDNISEDRKNERAKMIADLQSSAIYKDLITDKVVSSHYLPVMTTISNGVAYINGNQFSLDADIVKLMNNRANGENELKFATKVIALGIPFNGGIPDDFVNMLIRYKDKYGYYGKPKILHNPNTGESEKIENQYDLTSVFVMFDSKNRKALDELYKAKSILDIGWADSDSKVEFEFPYTILKKEYNNHLKKVYPTSQYLSNIDFELLSIDLLKAYQENEVAADKKYKGKLMQVTGDVLDIGKDVMGQYFVSLYAEEGLGSIMCYFDEKHQPRLGKLKKGEICIIEGRCDGMILGIKVALRNCSLD